MTSMISETSSQFVISPVTTKAQTLAAGLLRVFPISKSKKEEEKKEEVQEKEEKNG